MYVLRDVGYQEGVLVLRLVIRAGSSSWVLFLTCSLVAIVGFAGCTYTKEASLVLLRAREMALERGKRRTWSKAIISGADRKEESKKRTNQIQTLNPQWPRAFVFVRWLLVA